MPASKNVWSAPDVEIDVCEFGTAVFSIGRRYRYLLERPLDGGLLDQNADGVAFVMLNPSTADAFRNDPTITRCMNFARSWGCGRLVVVNLFAIRSTNPQVLYAEDNPIGPHNDTFIKKAMARCDRVVCAWGSHGKCLKRSDGVYPIVQQFHEPHCLAVNKDGEPVHPLYQPSSLKAIPYTRSRLVAHDR